MNKIYLFFIIVYCAESYLPPFSYSLLLRFSLPLIKITARIDRTILGDPGAVSWDDRMSVVKVYCQIVSIKETDKRRGSKSTWVTAHTLTLVCLSCFLRGQVCCTDYWQQNSVHVTVCLGLNFITRLHLTLRKKKQKKKQNSEVSLWKVQFFKNTVNKSTFDYWIKAEYEYWIVHLMNELLNQQTIKSFCH